MNVIESKVPILILSYQNCELYCCHLDGYKLNTTALLKRLAEIETILLSKPYQTKFRIWFNMDESKLDTSTIKLICESMFRFQNHIYKIAFIGLHGIVRWKFHYILNQVLREPSILKAYFLDAEQAKGWLI